MGEFTADLDRLKTSCQELHHIENRIDLYQDEAEGVRNGLLASGKGVSALKQELKNITTDLKQIERTAHQIKEGLEDIIRLYGITESSIIKNTDIFKYLKDYTADFFFDIVEEFKNKYEDFHDNYKDRQESIVLRIYDKNTREGFREEYREALQRIYDEVPAEYIAARVLYDKHAKELIVSDFNTVDGNGKGAAYTSRGKLYINTDNDLNNKRGDGTTFYHEYGHYIVYKEEWIRGGDCTGTFKEFEDSLRKEITQYCNDYEESFRKSGADQGYTGAQLEKYIEIQTSQAIKKDVNGSSNEYYHINNGISDIIDGVTNGKYQPSYGHGDGYWEKDQSKVANEAFAQFFSAQMTGDMVEIEKMKEIMPQTYDVYMEMIKDAAEK